MRLTSVFLTAAAAPDVGVIASTLRSVSLRQLAASALLLVVCIVLIRLILRAADKLSERSRIDRTLFGFLRSVIKIVLLFVTIMLVAGSLGINTSSLLAILSIAGLAVSLSIQNVLSNIASAVMILSAKPFRAGDYIVTGGQEGTVLSIGAIYTNIATFDNQIIHIPNSQITSGSITNRTAAARRRVDISVSASYDDAIPTVRQALLQAAQHEKILPGEPVQAFVTGYGDNAIEYSLRFWVRPEDYWTVYFFVLENIKTCFDDAGVSMTYPHLNVHFDRVPEGVRTPAD